MQSILSQIGDEARSSWNITAKRNRPRGDCTTSNFHAEQDKTPPGEPFGFILRPEFGALAMSASSIIVVVNALLMRRRKL